MTACDQCGLCCAPVNGGRARRCRLFARQPKLPVLASGNVCSVMSDSPVHLDRPPEAMDFVFHAFHFASAFGDRPDQAGVDVDWRMLLLGELIQKLPAPGTDWSADERVAWLQLMLPAVQKNKSPLSKKEAAN